MSLVIFPTKINSATVTLSFDFISALAAGETISGAVVSVTVLSGTDPNPSAIKSGVASITGQIVNQTITNGLVGVIYNLSCNAATNLGNQLILSGQLAVTDTDPYQ